MSRNEMLVRKDGYFITLFSTAALNEMANNDGIVSIWKEAVMPYFRL
jgi:hypothetical protein